MGFVKLDCGILNSSIWPDKDARDIFITALLMAQPFELREPTPTINVTDLSPGGWTVPPGWYGMVEAAGVGIIDRAGVPKDRGLLALARLCAPEMESRSYDFEGRRLVRIDGGYLVLNYIRYRDRDYTAAERMRRWRERKKRGNVTAQPLRERNETVTCSATVTHSIHKKQKQKNTSSCAHPREGEIRSILAAEEMMMDEGGLKKILERVELTPVDFMLAVEAARDKKIQKPPGFVINRLCAAEYLPMPIVPATTICRWNREGRLASVYRQKLNGVKLGYKANGALILGAHDISLHGAERPKDLLNAAEIVFKVN